MWFYLIRLQSNLSTTATLGTGESGPKRESRWLLCIGQIEASTFPLGIPRAFDTFAVPERREFDYQSLPGGGEFEQPPRIRVKSLAWRTIMGDAVLKDFRGKDRAFLANWLREKGLNKLCAVFEGI